MKQIWLILAFLISYNIVGQKATVVKLNLKNLVSDELVIRVYSPEPLKQSKFVIPQIVPGTYMKINYVKFYSDFSAYNINGGLMKVSRKDNSFSIIDEAALHYVEYTVKASLGNRKVWDNILSCAGTIITSKSALLNFQLITGYFENYKNLPFEIEVERPKEYYGASSIEKKIINDSTDILWSKNYADLIDQPIMYAVPDTTSFVINNHRFNIAVHSEKGKNSALELKPGFQKIMNSIQDFSGFTSKEDYSFIMYFVDEDRLNGVFKTFGAGSALEHKQSSVYYDLDVKFQSNYYYNWIVSHEYFHTITPLSFNSEKIENFNFRNPDMSKHVWLYEGFTDYFSFLTNAKYLRKNPKSDMGWAVSSSLKHKSQSMTQSGAHIIRHKNVFSWITKMGEIGNFYEKGKLIAMGLDMGVMEDSNGERRLIDVLLELKDEYENLPFKEEQLKDILISKGISGVDDYFEKYIEGAEIPPYDIYFQKLGWRYVEAKSNVPSYGDFSIYKVENDSTYYVGWARKNNLGLLKGDTIVSVNDEKMHQFIKRKEAYSSTISNPSLKDTLSLTYKRLEDVLNVTATPLLKKTKIPKVVSVKNPTKEQIAYRNMFFDLPLEH